MACLEEKCQRWRGATLCYCLTHNLDPLVICPGCGHEFTDPDELWACEECLYDGDDAA